MKLRLAVAVGDDLTPDSEEAVRAAHAAAAQKATAWSQPVYVGETTNEQGTRLLHYDVDAIPRTDPSIVTTSNAAPDLLPPTIA